MNDALKLASYLERTLLDELQNDHHDESCKTYLYGAVGEACTCNASDEWRATLMAIFHAVQRLRAMNNADAFDILLTLAEPYRTGSGYPK